jgi:FkbM family methyltransferase
MVDGIRQFLKKNLNPESKTYCLLKNVWYKSKLIYQYLYFFFMYPDVRIVVNKLNENLDSLYKGQFFQDSVIDKLFNHKKNGFFVDIGANSPIRGNNTYFFEKNRNWSGIAIDPLPKYIKEWAKERKKTKFVSVACGNREGKIKFVVINSNQGGWEDMLSASRKNVRKEDLLYPHKTITVPIKTLNSILTEGNIKSIDFISIDVEGGETDVLFGLDLVKYKPTLILLENTKNIFGSIALRDYLNANGYIFALRINTTDDVFLKV